MSKPIDKVALGLSLLIVGVQMAVLGLMLFAIHHAINHDDHATAAVLSLLFLAIVIDTSPRRTR